MSDKFLNLYTKEYIVIIEANSDLDTEKMSAVFNALATYYAFILHDKDFTDDGELKRNHFHLVIKLRKRTRFQTFINELSTLLEIESNRITIDRCINLGLSVQYLCHINDIKKFQYPPYLVFTNNKDFTDDLLQNGDNPTLTTSQLFEYVDIEKMNRKELLYKIGLGNYTKYFRVIDMLYRLNGSFIDNSDNND